MAVEALLTCIFLYKHTSETLFLMVKLILNQIRHDYCKTHCKTKQISMQNKFLNQCWQM